MSLILKGSQAKGLSLKRNSTGKEYCYEGEHKAVAAGILMLIDCFAKKD